MFGQTLPRGNSMKTKIFSLLLITSVLLGCGSGQKITGSWVDRGPGSKGPYNKVFVVVLTWSPDTNRYLETEMAKILIVKGYTVVRGSDAFPSGTSMTEDVTKEQLVETIKKIGCDAVLTLALLDTKKVETYHPGTTYSPSSYNYYGNFYGYYNYYQPRVYTPEYYTVDKTYYIETNLYNTAEDFLVWSVQSEAYNPKDLKSWFQSYAEMLMEHLKNEGWSK
jgi:hypothetical protein